MSEVTKEPKLRFPEFFDDWKSKRFEDTVKLNQGLAILKSDRFSEKGKNRLHYITIPFLEGKLEEFIENPNESVVCEKDDIIVTRTGSGLGQIWTGNYGVFHNNFFKVQPLIKSKTNKKFLYYYLLTPTIQNKMWTYAGVGAIPDLNHSDFYSLPYFQTELKEQEKIATFLTSVDKKISQQQQKKSLLEQYKKGVMQKIFSQELRFKDDEGNSYPDWEEKRLGEVLDYEQPTKYIVTSTEYDRDYKTPVLTAGKSFILGYTNEEYNIFSNVPVIIFDDFTMANKYVDFDFKVKSSAMKILKPVNDSINIKFVFESIQMINYPKGDEHKRFWISEYSRIKIKYPCEEEQIKIADFLYAIDDKIQLVYTQLEHTQTFKKGLLQQLFV